MKQNLAILFILLMGALFSPQAVYAQEATEEDEGLVIAEEDLLFQGVQGLLGRAANIIVGGETPDEPDHIIAVLVQTLNYGVMAFALLFMVVRGIVWFTQLSGDKKGDTLLDFQSAPLSVMVAVILLLPLPSGYSAIQLIVIKVAGESISLANKETNAGADFLDTVGSYAVNPSVMNSEKIIFPMFENAVCVALANHAGKKTVAEPSAVFQSDLDDDVYGYAVTYGGIYSKDQAILMYRQDIRSGFANGKTVYIPPDACGSTRIEFGSLDENYADTADVLQFRQGMIEAYKGLELASRLEAANFVDHLLIPISIENGPVYNEGYPEGLEQRLRNHTEAFQRRYQEVLETLVQKMMPNEQSNDSALDNKRATDFLRKYGASYLGVFFWEYAKRNSVVANITSVKNSSSSPKYEEIIKVTTIEAMQKVTDSKNDLLSNIRFDYNTNRPDNTNASSFDVNVNLEKEIEQSFVNAEHEWDLGADFIFDFATKSMYEQSDPVLALADTGHDLIMLGEFWLVGGAIAAKVAQLKILAVEGSVAALTSNPFTGAGAIPVTLGKIFGMVILDLVANITPLAFTFMAFGALLAFWIPSIPLFHWVSGIVGFFIVLAQAIILTPLLGIATLLSTEKGFLNGKTQHGYMSIIQLFTYLPIMVLSFFIAYLIAMFGAKFIQVVFLPFFTMLNGNNVAGVVTGIFMVAIFILMNFQLFNRVFALITINSEKAGKFVGGGEEMLGDAQGVGAAKGGFVAVSKSSGAGAQNLHGQMTSGGGQEDKNAPTDKASEGGNNPQKNRTNSRTS